MTCTRAEELLADYCTGELQGPLRGELEAHLRDCAECRALADALSDVLVMLRAARDPLSQRLLEPPPGLAERAAAAAVRAGRAAARGRFTIPGLPRRVQTLAAVLTLVATAAVFGGTGAASRGWPQRMVRRAATAGLRLVEQKDRAVEDLRMLRVMVAATFAGRVDRVNERVDDYRRLLERRKAAPGSPSPEAPPPSDKPQPRGALGDELSEPQGDEPRLTV